jgi:hypothetical protein
VHVVKSGIITVVIVLNSTLVLSQSKIEALNKINQRQDQKIDSLINFNTDKKKLEYLSVLPSVNYDFLAHTFSVGISISNLSNFYQNKQRNKIELERLKFQLQEKKENDLFNLEKEYELIQDAFAVLKLELENNSLVKEIYNLKKSQYENNKITLEDWLNVQKNNQDRNLVIFSKRKSLISKMKHYEVKTKSACFHQEIDYLSINQTNQ